MPDGVQEGDVLQSSENKIDFKTGNAMPLLHLPLGTKYIALKCSRQVLK